MKIAVVHDWEPSVEQELTWRDGLCAAIRELGTRHEVKFWTCGEGMVLRHPYFPIHFSNDIPSEVRDFNPDVILHWADCTRPNAMPLKALGKPMALCFAGGDTMRDNTMLFDHFFVESSVYKARFESMGKSVSIAFGTNTDLFQPTKSARYFDAIFPATFALWKRHKLFADAVHGLRTVAVGYQYQDHEQECWQICRDAGVLILPHISAEALRTLYAASKCVVITSNHQGGSQRTVLEAMAMNIPVIVMNDSDKTTEYVREGGGWIVDPEPSEIRRAIDSLSGVPIKTRDYVLSKWSHIKYAEALEHGLQSIIR